MIEVRIDNADGRLCPGCFARATILTQTDSSAITVPEEAIVRYAGVTKLFTLSDGLAREVPVQAVRSLEVSDDGQAHTWIEVSGPITPGMAIITSGQTQLAEGTFVRVRGQRAVDE
jgi:multidrug efflux pump subunit AcrA (membrane-fusion protein)